MLCLQLSELDEIVIILCPREIRVDFTLYIVYLILNAHLILWLIVLTAGKQGQILQLLQILHQLVTLQNLLHFLRLTLVSRSNEVLQLLNDALGDLRELIWINMAVLAALRVHDI